MNFAAAKKQKKSYEYEEDELTATKAVVYLEIMMFSLQKLLS